MLPAGKLAGLTVIVAQLTASVYGRVPKQPFASVALMVKFAVPAWVGVPVNAPLAASASPAGSCPALTLMVKLYGAVPPAAVSTWL